MNEKLYEGTLLFNYICFFISQAVFLPTFLLMTKMVFKPRMRVRDYIGYALLSPLCVYLFSIFFYGILSVFFEKNGILREMVSYADLFALVVSFLFAFIYSNTGKKQYRSIMFFMYNCFYMVGMVFNLVYETRAGALLCSVLVPCITAHAMLVFLAKPLAKIVNAEVRFYPAMLTLPVIAEAMLVLRFLLNIVSRRDPLLDKYDILLMIYSTLFGYIILLFIFICTGIVIRDMYQIDHIRRQDSNLSNANEHINRLTFEMLKALVATIEAKDEYTNDHSNRVAYYTQLLADQLGYDAASSMHIADLALLHDIGKIGISDDIISKESALTLQEHQQIIQHPQKGAEILKLIEEIPDLYVGALYHHERWDGKGYPSGIKGEEIPEFARIISVADAYDSMSSKRSYRPALPQSEIRLEIENGIGTQFDPKVARAMLRIIDEDVHYTLRQPE